jgi:hypothetical protein
MSKRKGFSSGFTVLSGRSRRYGDLRKLLSQERRKEWEERLPALWSAYCGLHLAKTTVPCSCTGPIEAFNVIGLKSCWTAHLVLCRCASRDERICEAHCWPTYKTKTLVTLDMLETYESLNLRSGLSLFTFAESITFGEAHYSARKRH